MKIGIGLFPTAVWIVAISSFSFAASYSGGSGTAEDPFRISNLTDWQTLTNTPDDWDDAFILTVDLDLSGQTYTQAPIAPDINVAGLFQGTAFAGSFDGKGHSIRNLTIQAAGKDYVGLFGYIYPTGVVKNLNVHNVQIQGRGAIGGVAGCLWWGTIKNCSVTGTVKAEWSAGGIAGQNAGNSNSGGLVLCCIADCTAQAATYSAGGLVGDNGGVINGCHAAGRATATLGDAGGLAGFNYGSLNQSYSIGTAAAPKDVGGLVGRSDGDSWACFWDMDTSGLVVSGAGEGRTTAELKMLATFIDYGWDFLGESVNGTEDFWRMCSDGIDYPKLWWESGRIADLACPDGVDLIDFAVLSAAWQIPDCGTEIPCGPADINQDNRVDLADLALFAQNWMTS